MKEIKFEEITDVHNRVVETKNNKDVKKEEESIRQLCELLASCGEEIYEKYSKTLSKERRRETYEAGLNIPPHFFSKPTPFNFSI